MTSRVPAVDRAAAILGLLRDRAPRTLRASEVATALGIHRASAFTVLGVLGDLGLVQRTGAEPTYGLGAQVLGYAEAFHARFPALPEARRAMFRVIDETGCGCLISGRLKDAVVVLDSVGLSDRRYRTGYTTSLDAPAGSIYYAWEAAEAVATWVRRSDSEASPTRVEQQFAAVLGVRARGYSRGSDAELGWVVEEAARRLSASLGEGGATPDERDALTTLADAVRRSDVLANAAPRPTPDYVIAPVFDHAGRVVLTLTLVTETPLSETDAATIEAVVVGAAAEVTRITGGRAPRGSGH